MFNPLGLNKLGLEKLQPIFGRRILLDFTAARGVEAMKAGASFVNSMLFLVNEKKYFASTDGSYIDQDIHRLWAPFFVLLTVSRWTID